MLDAADFKPPAPGAWELEQTHLQRPLTHWVRELFTTNMMRGFKETTAKYGLLLDYLDVAVINGFGYMCPRPVGAPKGAKGPPPKFIFKLLARLHPEIRRRIRRNGEVWANKAWRDDVTLWYEQWLPRIRTENRALIVVDPRALDDQGLIAHLVDVEARVADGVYRHHAMNGCAMVALGDFLVHAAEWTGKSPRELLALMRGSAPISIGAKPELDKLAAAIRANADATAMLASSAAPGEIVERLRTADGDVGVAARAYLDEAGLRLVGGYDVGELSGLEMPEMLVGAIRSAVADTGPSRADEEARELADTTARVRALVPEEKRAAFDELLAEARLVYPIRDERGYNNEAPALGIARRAILAAGERLARRGVIDAADHAIDLTPAELRSMLAGKPGPSNDEVAKRVKFRLSHSVADAPAQLGLPPSGPPPAEWLPSNGARMARALGIVLQHMFEVRAAEAKAEKVLRGLAASPGTYEGRARVVDGPQHFARLEKGDVLVARMTCPSYNVVLPLLGGVVTDRGGLLSHAAIVAREYGVPAVVGTIEATRMIPDCARVRVDGATGEVRVL